MSEQKHVIYLHSTGGLPAAYFGYPEGEIITINHPIYCRVPREKAMELSRGDAISMVQQFRDKGYGCHCEPPITVIY